MVKYFRQQGAVWELSEEVRRAVQFRQMNLTGPWPGLQRMDLVMMRNVMIYFDVETKKGILGRVARVLRPDGYLLLGAAETTLNLNDSFRRVEHRNAGFYQLVG
jgi:chemotaxis protein methyltransferase CheR